jgi:RNA polymerase sigma-70 factor (ECF subfamily)
MLHLTTMLVDLLPENGDTYALAALLHYAEARRPARVDATGMMVPLSLQDPSLWRREFITNANAFLARAIQLSPQSTRTLQARLQSCWCARSRLSDPAPWDRVRQIYDELLLVRDDPIVRLNRIVAVAELDGADAALGELAALYHKGLEQFGPYHAVRADLLIQAGRPAEARAAYQTILALDPPLAERRWLAQKLAALSTGLH